MIESSEMKDSGHGQLGNPGGWKAKGIWGYSWRLERKEQTQIMFSSVFKDCLRELNRIHTADIIPL